MLRCGILLLVAAAAAAAAFVALISPTKTIEHGRNLAATIITRRWHDPKSVILKNSEQTTNLASLRIVAFGTSKTWGAGLEDPQRESYIKLLSPHAVNLGLRATPADYPSLCLHSMIGEQVFDVIILEFSPNRGQHPDFDRLAKRLRARFPLAIILYLPIFMLLNDVDYQGENLQTYLMSQGVTNPKDPLFYETVNSLNETNLVFPALSNKVDLYEDTVAAIGGHMIEFPPVHQRDDNNNNNDNNNNIKQMVSDNAMYYGNQQHPWDFVHPNELGHHVMADMVRQKIVELFAQEPRDHGKIHSWPAGHQDRCSSWFLNGNITDDVFLNVDRMTLQQFHPEGDGKWALEVDRMGGSFTVQCVHAGCSIYISHMAYGPDRLYPRVMVSLNTNNNDNNDNHKNDNHNNSTDNNDAIIISSHQPKLIDPLLFNFHLTLTTLVGTMEQPGIATVTVKPIPEDIHSHFLFRITGVIQTPPIV